MEKIIPQGFANEALDLITGDESGSVLLITVVILMLLTILGISGMNTATTDIQITRNYTVYKQNLALADAAVNRAVSRISYGQSTEADSWVNDISDLYTAGDKYFKEGTNWNEEGDTPVLNEIKVAAVIADWDWDIAGIDAIKPTTLPGHANTEYVVYINKINSPYPDPDVFDAVVIARSTLKNAEVILEAGFNTQ